MRVEDGIEGDAKADKAVEHDGLVALQAQAERLERHAGRVQVERVDSEQLHDREEQEDHDDERRDRVLGGEGLERVGSAPFGRRPDEGESKSADRHHQHLRERRREEEPSDGLALGCVRREVAGVVVAAFGPSEAGQRDREGETVQPQLPGVVRARAGDTGIAMDEPVDKQNAEDDPKRDDQHPKDPDHGGVAEERQDDLDAHRQQDEHDLRGRAGTEAGFYREHQGGAHYEDETLGFEPELSEPVEERHESGPVRAVARAVDGEDGRPGLWALQAADAHEEPREVADDDDRERLPEGEAEVEQDRPVDEVLDVETGPRPHARDVPRLRPPLGLWDEVNTVLLNVKCLIRDRQIGHHFISGGDRHDVSSRVPDGCLVVDRSRLLLNGGPDRAVSTGPPP